MDIRNQYIVLGLIYTRKIKVDQFTGSVFSGEIEMVGSTINGYKQYHFNLTRDSIFTAYGHCIIYLSKYGVFDPNCVIDHIDHDRGNNAVKNLRCVSQSENTQHTEWRKTKTSVKQVRVPPDVRTKILELCRLGQSYSSIGDMLGITRQTVSRIKKEEWAKLNQADNYNWLEMGLGQPLFKENRGRF